MTVIALAVHFLVLTFSLAFFTRFVFPGLTVLAILGPQAFTPFFQDRVGSEVYVDACYLTLPNLGGVGRADDIAG